MSKLRVELSGVDLEAISYSIVDYMVNNISGLAGNVKSYGKGLSKREIFDKLMLNHVFPNISRKHEFENTEAIDGFVEKYFSAFLEEITGHMKLNGEAVSYDSLLELYEEKGLNLCVKNDKSEDLNDFLKMFKSFFREIIRGECWGRGGSVIQRGKDRVNRLFLSFRILMDLKMFVNN